MPQKGRTPQCNQATGSAERTVEIPYQGQTIKVTYDRARVSDLQSRTLQKAFTNFGQGDLTAVKTLISAFAALIVRWNLTTESGEPVPITLQAIVRVPLAMLRAIITAIQLNEQMVSSGERADSGGTSSNYPAH